MDVLMLPMKSTGVEFVRAGVYTIEETKMTTTNELTSTDLMLKNFRLETENGMDVAVEVCVGMGDQTQPTDSLILFPKTTVYQTQECLQMTLSQMKTLKTW